MLSANSLPPSEELKKFFHYDPATGNVVRIKPVSGKDRNLPGTVVGNLDTNGYLRTKIFGKRIQVSAMVWCLVHGYWPSAVIDHKDRNRSNNRIENLRLAVGSQNHYNTKQALPNKTGFRGVYRRSEPCQKPYRAFIRTRTGKKLIGSFRTAQEASLAYETAAQKLHGAFYLPPENNA